MGSAAAQNVQKYDISTLPSTPVHETAATEVKSLASFTPTVHSSTGVVDMQIVGECPGDKR